MMVTLRITLSLSLASSAPAQSLRPSAVIDLAHVKIDGTECVFHLPAAYSTIQWLDEGRLLVENTSSHCDQASEGYAKRSESEAVLVDRKGKILASVHGREVEYTRGPHGTVAAINAGSVDLLNGTMHSIQKLPCPDGAKTCGVILDPSPAGDDKFALCSYTHLKRSACDFYERWPAEKIRQEVLPALVHPYTRLADRIWQVSAIEQWQFQNGQLTRVRTDGTTSLVSQTDFVGKNGGGCLGQTSEALPRRFLATCYGTHWYSDELFDNIFGFSHTVLFDVASGNILGQVDGGAYIRTSLSPSGRQIAVLNGDKVRLYEIP